ncbi:MAG: endonuclease/exonuclease/phosphatase family protein [Firmicutes bacterium]|nr:endonuclease/exonuclease/phosphatase family protein [Bacillota bacterium]
MKLATFNVRHFCRFDTNKVDYDSFADAIRSIDADIMGINESFGQESIFAELPQARIIAEKLGYHWYFAPALHVSGMGLYGNSLLSRYPILNARSVPIPDPIRLPQYKHYETRCVLLAEVEIEAGPLTLAVTHFGLNPDEQQMALQTVQSLIRTERFILMGDLNVTPENSILVPIRERLYDTAEKLKEGTLSFPSDHPDRKIDYIFVSHDIDVSDADIPAITVSDHRPYILSLTLS